jgi:hypothetical protein
VAPGHASEVVRVQHRLGAEQEVVHAVPAQLEIEGQSLRPIHGCTRFKTLKLKAVLNAGFDKVNLHRPAMPMAPSKWLWMMLVRSFRQGPTLVSAYAQLEQFWGVSWDTLGEIMDKARSGLRRNGST